MVSVSTLLRKVIGRPAARGYKALINMAYNELLDIFDDNFSELFHVVNDILDIKIMVNRDESLPHEKLYSSDILILGCPSKKRIPGRDIENILKYIREGGNLLVISDAGGDLAHETNLNDLLKHLHVTIEPTMVRDQEINMGSSLAPIIENVNVSHPIVRNVMRVVIGGGCTLNVEEPAVPIINTSMTSWIEQFHPNESEAWKILKVGEHMCLMAGITHGQGKVLVVGDLDMFSNDADYGIDALDNKILVKNIFSWFLEPVEVSTIIDWLVTRIANLESKYENLARKFKEYTEKDEDNINAFTRKIKFTSRHSLR
ncbi:MAG: hypothetical protein ACTSUE_07180 [Promethearchaeota archaeon]